MNAEFETLTFQPLCDVDFFENSASAIMGMIELRQGKAKNIKRKKEKAKGTRPQKGVGSKAS